MFRTWLKNNRIEDFDLSGTLIPPAKDRSYWDAGYRAGYIKNAEAYLDYSWPPVRATDYMAYKQATVCPTNNRPAHAVPLLLRCCLGKLLNTKAVFCPTSSTDFWQPARKPSGETSPRFQLCKALHLRRTRRTRRPAFRMPITTLSALPSATPLLLSPTPIICCTMSCGNTVRRSCAASNTKLTAAL